MRGPFNTTCDVWSGPTAVPPNFLKAANIPCRLVVENLEHPIPKFLLKRTHYLTIDAFMPLGAAIQDPGIGFTIDCRLADRIAVPTGVAVNYGVLFVELVTPNVGTNYYRVHLVALPDPGGDY